MSNIIEVENLTKSYIVHHNNKNKYDSLSELITLKTKNFISKKKISTAAFQGNEEFKALKNLSFQFQKGDRVGIIGRNGAGKSTLLKILSRITEPTKGIIKINGRVSSLLEVGTGFHPDLTGRENIYLNGAILGMSRSEIKRKFDEIVSFAEVEYFLDTPVKKYSSGMYVRLAFAVAAHLESEILIVDEVLAVGDAEFQKKCLGRIQEISQGDGRTILFVSHNIAAVQNICNKGLYLDKGEIKTQGNIQNVIEDYLNNSKNLNNQELISRTDRVGNGELKFVRFSLLDANMNSTNAIPCGENGFMNFEVNIKDNKSLNNVIISVAIDDISGQRITQLSNEVTNQAFYKFSEKCFKIQLYNIPLRPGQYIISVFCTVNNELSDWIQNAGILHIGPGDFYNSGKLPLEGQGNFLMKHSYIP